MLQLLEMTYENAVETFARRYGKGSALATAVYREFYRNLNPDAWTTDRIKGSPGLADRLKGDMACPPGRIVGQEHQDGVVKLVTKLEDRHRIESVILPLRTHHTICVSSQVGCRMGCRFCISSLAQVGQSPSG